MSRYNVSLNANEDHLLPAVINTALADDNVIIPGAKGLIIRVYKFFFVLGATATNLTFQDGDIPRSGPLPLLANATVTLDFDTKPWYTMSPGNSWVFNSSSAVQISGTAYYTQLPA